MLNLRNIINILLTYINMIRKNNNNKGKSKEDKWSNKKNQNRTTDLNSLDLESDLLRSKVEDEKARKRTRGPYRKSHVQ